MYFVADRKGNIEKEDSLQDRFFAWMYGHVSGRIILKLLVQPPISRFFGRVLDSGASKLFIPPFIRRSHLNMSEYKAKNIVPIMIFLKESLPQAPEVLIIRRKFS